MQNRCVGGKVILKRGDLDALVARLPPGDEGPACQQPDGLLA